MGQKNSTLDLFGKFTKKFPWSDYEFTTITGEKITCDDYDNRVNSLTRYLEDVIKDVIKNDVSIDFPDKLIINFFDLLFNDFNKIDTFNKTNNLIIKYDFLGEDGETSTMEKNIRMFYYYSLGFLIEIRKLKLIKYNPIVSLKTTNYEEITGVLKENKMLILIFLIWIYYLELDLKYLNDKELPKFIEIYNEYETLRHHIIGEIKKTKYILYIYQYEKNRYFKPIFPDNIDNDIHTVAFDESELELEYSSLDEVIEIRGNSLRIDDEDYLDEQRRIKEYAEGNFGIPPGQGAWHFINMKPLDDISETSI